MDNEWIDGKEIILQKHVKYEPGKMKTNCVNISRKDIMHRGFICITDYMKAISAVKRIC